MDSIPNFIAVTPPQSANSLATRLQFLHMLGDYLEDDGDQKAP